MAKKKSKQIMRPWCWYCEREFEDEKVLMQHQKAKHFKCNMCPRRLNTAGGLAVHIQQVHKLEPENLPRIENALPGRDGYEVEIFGMEGIPAPDVADYKRRKEIELGLNPGTISQPPNKRPKVENRPLSEEELRAQLAAHRALMGAGEPAPASTPTNESSSAFYGAPPQAYSAPPTAMSPPTAGTPGIPSMYPPGAPPHFVPPPGFPGAPPFPPMPGMPMLPPGMVPPGFPPMPMPPMPPGMVPPPGMGGVPPFPGMPFSPPPFLPPGVSPPPGFAPPMGASAPPVHPPAPSFVPASTPTTGVPPFALPAPAPASVGRQSAPTELKLPNPDLAQTNAPFKKPTDLKWKDPNFSPEEHRAIDTKYFFAKDIPNAAHPAQAAEETRGKKRARAEDFL